MTSDATAMNVAKAPALAKAMVAFQKALKPAKKDGLNPHFKSRYADLESCWDAIREPLTANGLAIIQITHESDGNAVTVETVLLHESGESIRGRLTMRPSKVDPQGIGSAITYARRYGLAAITGLTQTDDDGNDASRSDTNGHSQKQTASPAIKKAAEFEAKVSEELKRMGAGQSDVTTEDWLKTYAPEFAATCEKEESREVGERIWALMCDAAKHEKIAKAQLREMYRQYREQP